MKNRYRTNLLKQHREPDWDPSHGCHTVARLARLFNIKRMAEIGVCYGHTAVEVLDKVNISQYFMIDKWDKEEIYDKIFANFFMDPAVTIIKQDSIKAVKEVPDDLDMIYLDTYHTYAQTFKEINAWFPKLKHGGVFVGDGYGYKVNGDDGTKRAVHQIFPPSKININLGKDYIYWVMRS